MLRWVLEGNKAFQDGTVYYRGLNEFCKHFIDIFNILKWSLENNSVIVNWMKINLSLYFSLNKTVVVLKTSHVDVISSVIFDFLELVVNKIVVEEMYPSLCLYTIY